MQWYAFYNEAPGGIDDENGKYASLDRSRGPWFHIPQLLLLFEYIMKLNHSVLQINIHFPALRLSMKGCFSLKKTPQKAKFEARYWPWQT